MSQEFTPNLDNPKEKMLLLEYIRQKKGKCRVTFTELRPRRTDRQNRFYWPAFVQPFADFLRGQGHPVTDDDAHEIFKRRYLSRQVVNETTGEALEFVQSTTKLTTKEFNEYLDNCAALMLDYAGIPVPDPSVYYEHEPELAIAGKAENPW